MPQDEERMQDVQSAATVDRLMRAHGGYVRSLVRRQGVPTADVADVSQEVWIVVVRRLHTFEGRSAIRSWLYGVSRRVCHDYFRRAHRRYERPLEHAPEPAQDAVQHRRLEASQQLELVQRASAELTPDRLELLDAMAAGSASVETLARRHRCADKTVFSRLYAARDHLRRALRRAGYALLCGLLPTRRAAARGLSALSPSPGGWALATVTCACAATLMAPAAPDALEVAAGDGAGVHAPRLLPYTRLPLAAQAEVVASAAGVQRAMAPRVLPAPNTAAPAGTATTSSIEFTVFDVVEPAAELRLRQVAFMEFVPYY